MTYILGDGVTSVRVRFVDPHVCKAVWYDPKTGEYTKCTGQDWEGAPGDNAIYPLPAEGYDQDIVLYVWE